MKEMGGIVREYGWEDFRQKQRTAAHSDRAVFDRLVGDYAVSNVVLHFECRGIIAICPDCRAGLYRSNWCRWVAPTR